MPLQPHQLRVVEEHNDLSGRLAKLIGFLETSTFAELDKAEQSRLRNQALAMQLYMNILIARIESF